MRKIYALTAAALSVAICLAGCGRQDDIDSSSGNETQEITFQNEEEGSNQEETPGREEINVTTESAIQESEASVSPAQEESTYPKITAKGKVKTFGGTVMIGDSAYELYNYVESSAKKYANVINHVAKNLKGKAEVYDMVVPTSVGITLPDNKVHKVNSSNQNKAISSIYKMLRKDVRTVSLYDTLMQHRDEYIYFRTDHHWTGLGAYYAYQQYCQEKGIEPHGLSEYKTDQFGKYLGSFYTETGGSKQLRSDKLKVYYPVHNKKLDMEYRDAAGSTYHGSVICDGTHYGIQLKYCVFIAGDNAYTVVRNKKRKDGSSCVVVKESYGNAFVPYLADHYQNVYVVDYRYWTGSVTEFAKEKGVDDVIFLNNISMTRNAYLIGKLAQVQ